MPHLQIKNLSEEMHAALRARASERGTTMSKLVIELLESELARASMNEWIEKRNASPLAKLDVDVTSLLDDVRGDYDPH